MVLWAHWSMVQPCWVWSSPSQTTSLSILCSVGGCESHLPGFSQMHCAYRPAVVELWSVDLRSSEKHGSGLQPGLWWVEEDFDSTRIFRIFPEEVQWCLLRCDELCVSLCMRCVMLFVSSTSYTWFFTAVCSSSVLVTARTPITTLSCSWFPNLYLQPLVYKATDCFLFPLPQECYLVSASVLVCVCGTWMTTAASYPSSWFACSQCSERHVPSDWLLKGMFLNEVPAF